MELVSQMDLYGNRDLCIFSNHFFHKDIYSSVLNADFFFSTPLSEVLLLATCFM